MRARWSRTLVNCTDCVRREQIASERDATITRKELEMKTCTLVALVAATAARGLYRRTGLRASSRRYPDRVAHRLSEGGRRRKHEMVGAVRRPGPQRTDRDRVARQSRRAHRRRPGRSVPRRVDGHPLAAVSADRLQRRRQSLPVEPPRRAGDPVPRRPVLHAIPGVARRVVATRPLRSGASPDRSRAGAGLRQRAGAARRRAVAGGGRGVELHRAARARPAARDRTGDGGAISARRRGCST